MSRETLQQILVLDAQYSSQMLGETSKWLASLSKYDHVQPKHLKEDPNATIVFKGS
ncbi:hypothetical protein SCLCIDRAFT_34850 [Scleroderma citrinum Foug A]|uniref:Uncharacterized protein n=1 Tax=Scleroderma citrinum Foug A TaxID=1036808 RepID=A0A0C2ZA24_9AGAM|nr:hypothetical protein SCLCIDRAFT_34850 [Scleroderma citrinum Foug A]